MSNEVYFDVLFPTFVLYSDNTNIVTDEIVKLSKKIITENADKPYYSNCTSTVKTNGNILEMPAFADIKKAIIFTLGAYVQKLKIDGTDLRFSASWLNLYNKHGYQDLHNHNGSKISGVFYIKSEGNKDLIFQSPSHFFQPITPDFTEINLDNCSNVEYHSEPGRCYIFPSHLMHRTLPATSERISLSFNII